VNVAAQFTTISKNYRYHQLSTSLEFTIAPVGAIEKVLKKQVGMHKTLIFGKSMKLLLW
jgi:hypothetical protein